VASWFGPPLESHVHDAFLDEQNETNWRRMRILLPIMVGLHLVHVAIFWTTPEESSALAPHLAQWKDGLVLVHGVTAAVVAGLAIVAILWGRSRRASFLWPLLAIVYLLHGAAIAGVDQLNSPNVSPYMGYCMALAITVLISPVQAVLVYGVGLVAYVAALTTMQPSDDIRMGLLPNGPSISVGSIVLTYFLYVGRRRDFVQRVTIAEQKGLLERLNAGLAQRVEEQVAEIVARAEEADRLNAHLQAQVRTRSAELSSALSKLADRRGSTHVLSEGALLADRFEIGRTLGAGGSGVVYAGFDRLSRTEVAIKIIQATSAAQLDALHRFINEARTAATVMHPAIVRMLHVDVTGDGMFYQVQELAIGETLHSLLRRVRRCEPGVAARIVATLCEALAAAHAQGVIHRDVKPGNVVLTATAPGLKLLDFGVARLHEESEDDSGHTNTGIILGTPAFMSPEQVSGSRDVTGGTDVYAVGITLFLALGGRYPWQNTTLRHMVTNHLAGPAPDVRSAETSVPDDLAGLVARCLEREQQARPSATELAAALSAFANERDVPALDVLVRDGLIVEMNTADSHTFPLIMPPKASL
jgi:hypothetical protein